MAKKKKVTLAQLVVVANEFNSFMFEEESQYIDVELSRDDLKEEIEVMAADLEDTDTITEATAEILDQLDIEYSCKIADAEEIDTEEELQNTEETEEEEEEEVPDEETGEIVDTSKMKEKEVLGLAKEKGIRVPPPYRGKGKTGKAKTEALKKLRVYVADKIANPTETPKKKKTKEKPTNKRTGVKKAGGIGVIGTIIKTIKDAKKTGVTKAEILEALEDSFPERDAGSMKKTINVQVPNRINKERDFDVESVEKKGVVRFRVA